MLENACGFCIGNSMSPGTSAVSLRTSNRNFEGRSGTQDARVFLVSPEIAAVAAIYGRIVDPRAMEELKCPRVTLPKQFDVDDSMFIRPPEDAKGVKVVKGPHIGTVPRMDPLPERLCGPAAIKVGDKVTTDHIMPAGARLKHRSNAETYAQFVFEKVDPGFAARAAENRDRGLHNFIIAGESYGQGSSREHAALCPMFLGVKAVVAKSLERIHQANLINFGILPLVFKKASDYENIGQGDTLKMEGVRERLTGGGDWILRNETRGTDIVLKAVLSERQKQILLAGGLLNTVKAAG